MIESDDWPLARIPLSRRTGLRPFSPLMAPLMWEVWIDKLRLSLRGNWVGGQSRYAEYRDFVALRDPRVSWIGTISRTDRVLTVKSEKANRHVTFSDLEIRVNAGGSIFVELLCNPTRTLAHLMHGFTGADGFVDWLTQASPAEFFRQRDGVPLAFGGTDNWIADFKRVKTLLGESPFDTFLPIFCRQLWAVVALHLAPDPDAQITFLPNAAGVRMRGDRIEVDFRGHDFNVREIETYIERYHPRASAVVRGAADRCLMEYPDAYVSTYLPEFEREGRTLAFKLPITRERKVKVYAKRSHRIRFEVSYRERRGSVGSTIEERQIVPVLNREREAFITACLWGDIGRLLHERPQPELSDLREFFAVVEAAAIKRNCSPASTIAELIISGGMEKRSDDPRDRRLLRTDLEKRGVLARRLVTERALKGRPVWSALRGPYEVLCRKLRRGFME